MVGWQGCKVEGMLGQGRRTKVWAWQQVNEKFASIFVVRGVQMYFASFVLARPRISFPISPTPNIQPPMHTHTHTHKHIHTQKTPAFCIWSQFSVRLLFHTTHMKIVVVLYPLTHAHARTQWNVLFGCDFHCCVLRSCKCPATPTAHRPPAPRDAAALLLLLWSIFSYLHFACRTLFCLRVLFSFFPDELSQHLIFIWFCLSCVAVAWLGFTVLRYTSLHSTVDWSRVPGSA